jgi:hypothetical protein
VPSHVAFITAYYARQVALSGGDRSVQPSREGLSMKSQVSRHKRMISLG